MKVITALLIPCLLCACNPGAAKLYSSIPKDRPPTLEEAQGSALRVELQYSANDSFWATWRGALDVKLGEPQADKDALPATVLPVDGFGDLECFRGPQAATWTLDSTGEFTLVTKPLDPGDVTLTLTGKLVIHSNRGSTDSRDGTPDIEKSLQGVGAWNVRLGANCGPDAFAGGTSGDWSAFELDPDRFTADAEAGSRASLLLVATDGKTTTETEITGPATLVKLLGESLKATPQNQ